MKSLLATYKAKVAIVFLALLSATFLLDFLIFEKLLLNFPNEMEWDTSHWYNFAYARKQIKAPLEGKKVIIAGSSVALYSVLPEELFKESDKKIISKFYSHVALAPTDLYYYKEDIADSSPDLVVYMLNFADLQWEYLTIEDGTYKFKEKLWLDEYSDRYPARTYYPVEFLRDYFQVLNKKQILRLASKSLLYVNRYRHFAFDPLETWLDNHLRSGRSFQKYNGSIPREGIWSKGWTQKTSTLVCTFGREKEDSIFLLKNHTEIKVTIYSNDKNEENVVSQTLLNFDKSGWNTFPWEQIPNHKGISSALIGLEVLDGMGTAKEANLFHYGKDYPVGIRLSHYFCKDPDFRNKSYVRDSYLDEKRFSLMSESEYDEDYFLRILDHAEERFELGRLNTLRMRKKEIKNFTFKPWFEYEQLLRVSDFYKARGIPFVVIMSPENPLESKEYVNGTWYSGFIEHFKFSLGQNNQSLYDHTKSLIRKQFFFDPHHLTYDGAKYFNSTMEEIILKELQGHKQ